MANQSQDIVTSLREMKVDRFRVLKFIYEKSGGSTLEYVNESEIREALGLSKERLDNIVLYLMKEHLISGALGGVVSLEHQGIVELDAALDAPEEPTHYFPPVSNIINFNAPATNTQIQQGTIRSQQTGSFHGADFDAVRAVTSDLLARLHNLNLPDDQRNELRADLTSVEAQLASPRPKVPIIREFFDSVRAVLENAGGDIAADFVRRIDSLPW